MSTGLPFLPLEGSVIRSNVVSGHSGFLSSLIRSRSLSLGNLIALSSFWCSFRDIFCSWPEFPVVYSRYGLIHFYYLQNKFTIAIQLSMIEYFAQANRVIWKLCFWLNVVYFRYGENL